VTKFQYTCEICGTEVHSSPAMWKTGRGIGTWHCPTCPYYRRKQVTRFIGSGKESEKHQTESVSVRRHVKVQRRKVS
jgi:ribosome-binding protein aMBF1 (putative translation factor)